jgi:hypothetical protein
MEVGVQTDTLTNKNIVVIRDNKKKAMGKPRVKKQLKSIPNATPDIKQQWRMWKGIDERNMLRNVEIDEDIIDKLTDVFGVNMTEADKIRETFEKGRGKMIIGTDYSKEQLDNRRVARRIGGDNTSAYQAGMENRRAYTGWEGADFAALDRVSRNVGRSLEEVFPFSSINWGEAPAPRISMSEVEASQRPRVGSREMASLGESVEGMNIGGYNLRSSLNRAVRGAISSVGGLSTTRAESLASGASTRGRAPEFGLSEGMRSGPRIRR